MTTITITPSSIKRLLEGETIELIGGPTIKLRYKNVSEETAPQVVEDPAVPEGQLVMAAAQPDGTVDVKAINFAPDTSEPKVEDFPHPDVSDLTCAKCGLSLPTKRARGQHQRWCDGTLPSEKPVSAGATPCPKCGKEFKYAKALQKHVDSCGGGRPAAPVTGPGSTCCGADVKVGEPHGQGNRYCTECGEPCLWSAGSLPPSMPKPVKVLTPEEKELLEAVRGDDPDDF